MPRGRRDCSPPARGRGAAGAPRARGRVEEAVSALVNLGYRRPEAERAVQRVARNGEPLEEVIRAALQGLAG